MLKLKDFQSRCVKELIGKILNHYPEKITIKSPTGSGKTIILTKYIDDFLSLTSGKICFVWLTPGAGDLEEQSRDKFDIHVKGRKTKVLQDALLSGFDAGDICFINWEQVTKKDNTALREAEIKNLYDCIDDAESRGVEFIIIVDECHKNMTPKAKELMDRFKAKSRIMVSATISGSDIEISEDDVIASGLITKAIYVNEGISSSVDINYEHEYLIDKAIAKQKEIREEYRQLGKNINPLIIVQYPNSRNELIDRVDKYIETKGFNYNNKTVAKWLSDDKDKINIENITDIDDAAVFLHMKQAISTGWDCTRAKILVKLRENMKDDFEIQTIGRIRRMPEQRHYGVEVLDNCYLYTLDEAYKNEVLKSLSANEVKVVYLKNEFKNLSLGIVKELKSEDRDGFGERETAKLISEYYKNKYRLGGQRDCNQTLLEQGGYNFSKSVNITVASGKVSSESEWDNVEKISLSQAVDLGGSKLKDSIWIISDKVSIEYKVTYSILKRLFLGRDYRKKKIKNGLFLRLNSHEFFAFVVNNKDLIKYDFLEAISLKCSQKELTANKIIKTISFSIPDKDIVKYQKINRIRELSKNVYTGYTNDIVHSKPENRFQRFCEESNEVVWWYKNGDKSQAYLSVIYVDAREKQWAFYPDYILKIKDSIWIIETKGGETSDGESRNIDKLKVENKFEALVRYVAEHNGRSENTNNQISFAFVRDREVKDEYGSTSYELLYNNSEWVEEMSDPKWKPLEDILKL